MPRLFGHRPLSRVLVRRSRRAVRQMRRRQDVCGLRRAEAPLAGTRRRQRLKPPKVEDQFMARDKTAVIVFPPFNTPTSPPLGAAMLKGFVERELPDWRVKVLDLNLWTIERLLAALAAGRFRLDPAAFPEGDWAAAALQEAADVFRGRRGPVFYDRPDLYDRYGELFLRFIDTYTKALGQVCDAYESGGERPPLIQEFLDVILAEKPD